MNPQTLIQHERDRAARAASAGLRTARVAIVDPYSTGAQLAGAFIGRGLEAVAVLTAASPPGPADQLRTEDYVAVINHDENTADLLEQWNVRHIVAGTESGVPIADQLAHRLGLPGNDPASSAARRNKFTMSITLASGGLVQAKTGRAFNIGGARNIAYEYGGWPVVVKPIDSAGSDRVVIARSIDEVSAAAADILASANLFGKRNDSVLVQEYLSGEQYAVNTVSQGGKHRLVEIWHDQRTDLRDGRLIYDRMDLLEPGWLTRILFEYVQACLDAVGVEWGPAHSEVVLTATGPVLIETGARLQGGDSAELMRLATGASQTDAAVQATLDSATVHAVRARQSYVYRPTTQLFLQAPADAQISAAGIEKLPQIPGVVGLVRTPAPGAAVSRTVDLLSSPGTVYLAADTTQQVNQAYAAVRELETADLYYNTRGR